MNGKIKILLVVITICMALPATRVFACSCDYSALLSIDAQTTKATSVVVIEVVRYAGEESSKKDLSVYANVEEVLNGSVTAKNINIAGGVDEACGAEAKEFPIGSKWVLFLNLSAEQAKSPQLNLGVLGRCSPIFYPVKNNKVFGYKNEETTGLSIEELKMRILDRK